MLPTEKKEIQDEAFSNFWCAIIKPDKKLSAWSFTDFLNELKAPVERNVLLLGSYSTETDDDFRHCKAALQKLGYNGFLLKDSTDLPIQSNLEKLLAAIMCSCFVIAIDKQASGHLAELSQMLQWRFRPVIVLRETKRPTTAFLEDRLLTDNFFRVAILKQISPKTLLPHIKWARKLVDEQISNLNIINHWRKDS